MWIMLTEREEWARLCDFHSGVFSQLSLSVYCRLRERERSLQKKVR
ncbi:hypothetical protein HanPSC8_Chr02g0055041 [Helianthus annuus]|nr:hypothetical protein HanPSC8_Chr02g0055041 [Helianthus annuus]